MNNICQGLDDGFSGVAGVFYDFTKAFDFIDHSIIITKLSYYGINASALQLIKSYLTNRKQYVETDNCKSQMGVVHFGVPQGSILGPLLFKIFLNDINNLQLFGKLFIFADDISLFYPFKYEVSVKTRMEYDAAIITEFARINKLRLNANKTNLLKLKPYAFHNQSFSIYVDGILESFSTKYLGIHLQSNLSWDMHIKAIKSKIVNATGLLYKFSESFKLLAYYIWL